MHINKIEVGYILILVYCWFNISIIVIPRIKINSSEIGDTEF